MNVPNTLSALRLVLIPVFCVFFLLGPDYYVYAGLALALSALSDLFDGYFARKLNQVTELGKFLDPVADKLTLGAVVVCMWIRFHEEYPIVTPLFTILIIKEAIMAIGGMIVIRSAGKMVSAEWWGKIGTAVFYACMLGIVLVSINNWGGEYHSAIIITLIVLPVLFMIFALVRYFFLGLSILRSSKSSDESLTAGE
ncbi:MAG: CDP-alcohol phosphatidyltransferase family protein [Ruminococcaceae bacterium]|nr:CDP-alcohol phosphatidyltransferase family protein [Oscillospiraceae bacterium]